MRHGTEPERQPIAWPSDPPPLDGEAECLCGCAEGVHRTDGSCAECRGCPGFATDERGEAA